MIKPYLSDIINNHKTRGLVRYHLSDKTWLEGTSRAWKIQLIMIINFISSEDSVKTKYAYKKQ